MSTWVSLLLLADGSWYKKHDISLPLPRFLRFSCYARRGTGWVWETPSTGERLLGKWAMRCRR